MTLFSLGQAKAKYPLTLHRTTPRTAAQISRDSVCQVWTADAGEKIWKDTPLPANSPSVSAVSVTAARNEYASFLFVVKPFRNLSGITAEMSDLVSGPNRIASTNITARYVDSVPGPFIDAPSA